MKSMLKRLTSLSLCVSGIDMVAIWVGENVYAQKMPSENWLNTSISTCLPSRPNPVSEPTFSMSIVGSDEVYHCEGARKALYSGRKETVNKVGLREGGTNDVTPFKFQRLVHRYMIKEQHEPVISQRVPSNGRRQSHPVMLGRHLQFDG